MSKYDPLQQHLAAQPATVTDVTLSFGKVEEILGFRLPPSAYKYREWWSNPSTAAQHPYAQAWLAVGWEARIPQFDSEQVTFERTGPVSELHPKHLAQAMRPDNTPLEHQAPRADTPRRSGPPEVDCEANILAYLEGDGVTTGREPTLRYSSFDYCFNYFESFRFYPSELTSPGNLQMSCLQLGFYLASWGMLRGSADLLNHSVKVFEPLIAAIAQADAGLWAVDAHCYTPANLRLVFGFRDTIIGALGSGITVSDILVTKIMLGVFGCVPAFDTNFRTGFGVTTFNERALGRVAQYYADNQAIIDRYRVPTVDFATGQPSQLRYTRAKVIDMVFFIEGGRPR